MKVFHASTVVVESPDTTYSRVLLPICKVSCDSAPNTITKGYNHIEIIVW